MSKAKIQDGHPILQTVGFETIKLGLVGKNELLMHSQDISLDKHHKITQAAAKISVKRKKTIEDHDELSRLDFLAGMYFDDELGPYVPAWNLHACFVEAAKESKRGQHMIKGARVEAVEGDPEKLALDYDGPRDQEGLWKARYYDSRPVSVQRNTVVRTRAKFGPWALRANLVYVPSYFDRDDLLEIVAKAGSFIGLCDFRPRFGRFDVRILS